MEELELKIVSKHDNLHVSANKTVILLGSKGKLGFEFAKNFSSQGISYFPLDSRKIVDISDDILRNCVFLDLSGKNTHTEEDFPVIKKFYSDEYIDLIRKYKPAYIKITTCLINYEIHRRGNYVTNSKNQIAQLQNLHMESPFPLSVFALHSIYGGIKTNSFVDLVKTSSLKKLPLKILNPNQIRDFVHINEIYLLLIARIQSSEINKFDYSSFEVGTGNGYRLGDISEAVQNGIKSLLPTENHETTFGEAIVANSKSSMSAIYVKDLLSDFLLG